MEARARRTTEEAPPALALQEVWPISKDSL